MMFLFLLLLFAAAAAAIWFQGLWNAAVTLVNLILAMAIATNFYEPTCTLLEGAGLGSFTFLLDFLVLWILFALAFGILRAITDALSGTRVAFELPVEMAGRSILAVICGWIIVCFTAFSLHMAPLNSQTPLGAWSTPTAPTMIAVSPDRLWLGFVYSRSLGAFSNSPNLEQQNALVEFPLKYHQRRVEFSQPGTQLRR
jgi:hypothetical protein